MRKRVVPSRVRGARGAAGEAGQVVLSGLQGPAGEVRIEVLAIDMLQRRYRISGTQVEQSWE